MVVKNNSNKCAYCGACVGVCPTQALVLKDVRIFVDESKCISCGACVKICPVGAMELSKEVKTASKSKK
ncbi:MAG: 4Fe-4S binding protein [Candidatus Diapherotrites archaeon]|nr:4Fe-4S binding protein [Candidatus Diapherotrites archaeon]